MAQLLAIGLYALGFFQSGYVEAEADELFKLPLAALVTLVVLAVPALVAGALHGSAVYEGSIWRAMAATVILGFGLLAGYGAFRVASLDDLLCAPGACAISSLTWTGALVGMETAFAVELLMAWRLSHFLERRRG